jgi:hypothetical protein
MGAISTPEPGQPLDINYISEMANQINQLTRSISTTAASSSSVNGRYDITGNLKIFAETKKLVTASATSGGSETFSFTYPEFRFLPVATITITNDSGSDPGYFYTATLRRITTSRAEGIIKFQKSDSVSLSVSIIVIGI